MREFSASDASAKALSLASENAQGNGVKINFIESDWFENVGGSYDLIVSNPAVFDGGGSGLGGA